MPTSPPPAFAPLPDWEAFYRDYRKPGYVPGFEITSKLGGGTFGLVFRARKLSIGKDYAIKFLQVEDGEVRDAVLSELAQLQHFAQIDHPNLVSIEDRGEVDGIPYLVMAFAGTETLRDRLPPAGSKAGDAVGEPAHEPADRAELLRVFLQCCRGLSALHEHSLVHFDIKPANVFLKGSVARLGDYGLSKLVTHSRGSLSVGRGTPYYMAPELLRRRGDHRSDIYSLGVLLYEILCGRVPFTGDSEWEVLKQHETAEPALPAHLTAVERTVLQRCLHKDPDRRYQSVTELLAMFGAPAGPGAAAWSDVRDGRVTDAAAAARPAPSSESQSTAGAAAGGHAEDPYAGLARASREAFGHARVVARRAMRQAKHAARDAARGAGAAVRASVEKNYGSRGRRWRALRRLRRRQVGRPVQRGTTAFVAGVAEWFRTGRTARWLWTAAAALIAMSLLAAVMFLSAAPQGMRLRAAADAPQMPPRPSSGQSTFRVFTVPGDLRDLVSMSEPAWAALAERNPAAAKPLLLQHIARLRARAPIAPQARRESRQLPDFGLRGDGSVGAAERRRIAQLLVARRYDPKLARAIAAEGPVALAEAGEMMAELTWQSPDDLERAARLQRLLTAATGCRDLELVTDRRLSPAELAAYNRPVGKLWVWFVNEFAHTERAWRAYQRLL